MTLTGYSDGEYSGDVASTFGWRSFCDWADTTEQPALIEFADDGDTDNAAVLAAALEAALSSHPPPAHVTPVAEGLLSLLHKAGETFRVSDGLGDDDAEEDSGGHDLANDGNSTPDLPTLDELYEIGDLELQALIAKLTDAMHEYRQTHGLRDVNLSRILLEINGLYGDLIFAGKVLGMAEPLRAAIPEPKDLAVRLPDPLRFWGGDEGYRFPWLTRAVEWLVGRRVADITTFQNMAEESRREAAGDEAVSPASIKQTVAESLSVGEDFRAFQGRLSGAIQPFQAVTQTAFRTNTHKAYLNVLNDTLQRPSVAGVFPYVLFISTRDTRTRKLHRAFGETRTGANQTGEPGLIARVGGELHRAMIEATTGEDAHNCRCTLRPITEAEARARGYDGVEIIPVLVNGQVRLTRGVELAV